MPTTAEVLIPDIGDLSDVPVIEVNVSPGDFVSEGDTLIVVESDKATLEIPADISGTVITVNVAENDTVKEGTTIATIEQVHQAEKAATETDLVAADRNSTIIDNDDKHKTVQTTTTLQTNTQPPEASQTGSASVPISSDKNSANTDAPVYAPPSVRKLARELGVEIANVQGSGPKQRITRDDVKTFVKAQLTGNAGGAPSQISATVAAFPEWPVVDHEKYGKTERIDLNRIARKSGPALARNAMLIPHVTYFDKTDITDTESFRQQLNNEAVDEDAKITLLSFAVKAVVSALKAHPVFNSSLEDDQLIMKHYWNIGVAVDTANGLLVPVIKDADNKGVRQIGNEMARLAEAARGGALSPADMQGATFTISSLGSIGGTNFTPIINAPEVAILGLPRSEIQPVWAGEEFIPRRIQPLSLSFDHRVADGAEAARFMSTVCDGLNDFRRTTI